MATPVVTYVGAVLGVMAIATLAAFNLRAMAATGYRHWDADIDRIIARQQEKKHRLQIAALAQAETPGVASDAEPEIAVLAREPVDDEDIATAREEATAAPKSRTDGAKKGGRHTERKRQQYIPAAFATLPKFATTAATTTTTLLGLR